jgi:hypothetical protein
MKKTTRHAKRQPGQHAEPPLNELVQRLFFAEEVDPELVDNPVVLFVLDSIRSAPLPKDPL